MVCLQPGFEQCNLRQPIELTVHIVLHRGGRGGLQLIGNRLHLYPQTTGH